MRLSRDVCLLAALRNEFFQQRIHQRINAAHKEAGHRGHMLHRLSLGRARFDAGNVSFRHLPVTRQPEEQRHVDADSFADELLDGRQPIGRRRDLDQDVRPVQRGPQPAGFLDRALGVVRQVGIDLQADISILAVSPVVERPELVGGALHVTLAEGFVDCLGAFSLKRHGPNVLVVIVALRNRLFKDGRDSRSSPAVHPPRSNAGVRRWRSDRAGCSPARWTGQGSQFFQRIDAHEISSSLFSSLRHFGQTAPVTLGAAESCLREMS